MPTSACIQLTPPPLKQLARAHKPAYGKHAAYLLADSSDGRAPSLCAVLCQLAGRGKLNALLPEPDFGPNLNFIGLKTEDWVSSRYGWVLEKPPLPFGPADLYTAQKLTRAARLTQPPGVPLPAGVCAPSPAPSFVAAAASVSRTTPPSTAASTTASTTKRFFFF